MTEQNPYCCGDTGCVLAVPGAPRGVGTNAGCRCLVDPKGSRRVRVSRGIRWLAESLAAAEARRRPE